MPKLPINRYFLKKTFVFFLSLNLLLFSFLSSVNTVFAAEEVSGNSNSSSVDFGHVTFNNFKAPKTAKSGESLTLTTKVKNTGDIDQPSLYNLVQVGPENLEKVYAEKLYQPSYSLEIGQEKDLSLKFDLPKNLPNETLTLRWFVLTNKGDKVAFTTQDLKISDPNNNFIQATDNKVVKNGQEFFNLMGVEYEKGVEAVARTYLDNLSSQGFSVTSNVEVFERSDKSKVVYNAAGPEFSINPLEKKVVDFELPNLQTPASYLAQVTFYQGKDQISGVQEFRWIVVGDGAKILKVDSDSKVLKKDQVSKYTVSYVGPALTHGFVETDAELTLDLLDADGKVIASKTQNIKIATETRAITVDLVPSKSYGTPEIKAQIKKDGKVLDEYNIKPVFASVVELKNAQTQQMILAVVILVLSVLGIAFLLFKRVRGTKKLIVLVIVSGAMLASLFTFVSTTKAYFEYDCWGWGSPRNASAGNGAGGCNNMIGSPAFLPTNHNRVDGRWNEPVENTLYRPGDTIRYNGGVEQLVCGNVLGGTTVDFYIARRHNNSASGATDANVGAQVGLGSVNTALWNQTYTVPNLANNYKQAVAWARYRGNQLDGSLHPNPEWVYMGVPILLGPSRPTGLNITQPAGCKSGNYSDVNFTWNGSALADNYWVDVSTDINFSSFSNRNVTACTSCSVRGDAGGWSGPLSAGGNLSLTPGTRYYYRLYAYNSNPGSGIYDIDWVNYSVFGSGTPKNFTGVPACAATNTLNVRSSGTSGVSITGTYPGSTNYTQTSASTLSGTLTAPASSGGATFSNWSGCDSTSGANCTVAVSSGATKTVTANYTPPPGTNILNINSSGTSGVVITGTYPGTTNYTRTSLSNLSGTITAPATSGTFSFSNWTGCDSTSGANCTVSVSSGSTKTVTAIYTSPGSLGAPVLTPSSGLPCVTSGLTYGPGVSFNWSNVASATSYDLQVSIYSRQFPDAATGNFVNPGNGGYYVYKYSIAATNTTGANGWSSAGGMPTNASNVPMRLNPGTTYYWHARAKNATITGSWSSVGSFSATTCVARPDLIATGNNPTPSAVVLDTTPITFSGCVGNLGTATAAAGSTTSIRLTRLPATVVWTRTTTLTPLINAAPNPGQCPVTVLPSTTLTPGNYSYQVCADSINGVAESNEGNNCSGEISFEVQSVAAQPYIITENGNVGSRSSLINLDQVGRRSAANNSNVEYIRQVTAVTGAFLSFKNWVVNSTPDLKVPNKFGAISGTDKGFYQEMHAPEGCPLNNASTGIPNAAGKFTITPDSTLLQVGSKYARANCGTGKDATLIFVQGNLRITANLAYNRPTVLIVKGTIAVDPGVTEVNATLISDKSFNNGIGTSKLTVNGSVISMLDAAAGDPGTHLSRNVSGTESERLVLQPSHFYYLNDYAGISTTTYKEERP